MGEILFEISYQRRSKITIRGAKFSFLDDGFEKQYNEGPARIGELYNYIEGFYCMKTTARCHDMSPRFSHFKFLSNKRAPIASCHLTAIVILVFVYAVFWLDERNRKLLKSVNMELKGATSRLKS